MAQLVTKSKSLKSTLLDKPIFRDEFIADMTNFMWSFINEDVVKSILNDVGLKHINIKNKADIQDDDFSISTGTDYRNSIVFKGTEDDGHYVYVDNELNYYGTYEDQILYNHQDDGICHGYSLLLCLVKNDKFVTPNTISRFPLTHYLTKKNATDAVLKNGTVFYKSYILDTYIAILKLYKYLIQTKASAKSKLSIWENAMVKHFGDYKTDIINSNSKKRFKLSTLNVSKEIEKIIDIELIYLEGLKTLSLNSLTPDEQEPNIHLKLKPKFKPIAPDIRMFSPQMVSGMAGVITSPIVKTIKTKPIIKKVIPQLNITTRSRTRKMTVAPVI
jgi:hypothetical protein